MFFYVKQNVVVNIWIYISCFLKDWYNFLIISHWHHLLSNTMIVHNMYYMKHFLTSWLTQIGNNLQRIIIQDIQWGQMIFEFLCYLTLIYAKCRENAVMAMPHHNLKLPLNVNVESIRKINFCIWVQVHQQVDLVKNTCMRFLIIIICILISSKYIFLVHQKPMFWILTNITNTTNTSPIIM